ncbi:MAG: serine/threonine-protein kinase, partial [Candidatus Hydrogenedentota bacterium]
MVAHAGGQGSLIGATIGGYEVVALIGRGAMGAVYLARDVKLKRMVALKVLLGSLAKSPSLVKQFHQEAQASAPLNHPSIVRVYSAGIENGTPFIAMEYVEGEPLDRFLKRKGKVKWDVALHIGYKLAQGLESAHKAGVVHRDIKPSNI